MGSSAAVAASSSSTSLLSLSVTHFTAFAALLDAGFFLAALGEGDFAPRSADQRNSGIRGAVLALAMAMSATARTIHSKFAAPTEFKSASGAGFMKSIA
jgi:hypothetical protein